MSAGHHQVVQVSDLLKFAAAFFALPPSVLRLLNTGAVFWKDQCIESDSALYSQEHIIFYYCFGWTAYNAVVQAKINGKTALIAVCGAKSAGERDAVVCSALEKRSEPNGSATRDERT
jgi:hypothetical protein